MCCIYTCNNILLCVYMYIMIVLDIIVTYYRKYSIYNSIIRNNNIKLSLLCIIIFHFISQTHTYTYEIIIQHNIYYDIIITARCSYISTDYCCC